MPTYIFRYHNTTSDNEYKHRNHDYYNRHNNNSRIEHKRKYKYDGSLYGETVYDYESDYTGRTYSRVPSKHYYGNGNHNSESHPHDYHHNNGHTRRVVQYTPPRLEPTVKYGFNDQQREMELQQANQEQHLQSKMSLLDNRLKMDKHTHCDCHACPQKSSKMIPAMHYDELRCPHCAAYAQPSQEEIIAYPWTAQSYRPRRRVVRTESLPSERLSPTTESVAQASTSYKSQSTLFQSQSTDLSNKRSTNSRTTNLTRHISYGKKLDHRIQKEDISIGTPPKPLFRNNNNNLARSGTSTDYSRYSKHSPAFKRRSVMSPLQEGDDDYDDDIKPNDSISNASFPLLRIRSRDMVPNHKYNPKPKTQARVDENYTREKYFRSLEHSQPRPAKDTATEISRMLKGEYYDRRNRQTYTYNVKYAPGKIDGSRIPKK